MVLYKVCRLGWFFASINKSGENTSTEVVFYLSDLKSIEYLWEQVARDTTRLQVGGYRLTLKDGTQILVDDFDPNYKKCFGRETWFFGHWSYRGTEILKFGAKGKGPFEEPVGLTTGTIQATEKRLLKIEILRPSQ